MYFNKKKLNKMKTITKKKYASCETKWKAVLYQRPCSVFSYPA